LFVPEKEKEAVPEDSEMNSESEHCSSADEDWDSTSSSSNSLEDTKSLELNKEVGLLKFSQRLN